MAGVTEKDLEQKRARNERLRTQIADAEAKAASASQEQSRSIEAQQLDAETARLEAKLASAKEAAKVSTIKSGAEGPLAAATEQLKAAQEGTTPPGVAVDTNKSESSSETKASDDTAEKKE